MSGDAAIIPEVGDWADGAELHRYFVCDVFAERPLEGNQLAVFVDGRPFGAEQMQAIAREMNLSETVFLLPPRGGGDVAMRIFTPGGELPFAGHPVLGTAFVVGAAHGRDGVTLETGAGPVTIALQRKDGRIGFGRMQQPIPTWEPYARERELLAAVGVESSRLPVVAYRNGPTYVYVALDDEAAVAAVQPDQSALKALDIGIVCFAGSGRSWKARMFYPGLGVAEDPATGSAAGPLAVHLARHGEIAFGDEIEIRQGAEIGRPSVLYARTTGTGEQITCVEVAGAAVVVAEGRYRVGRR